MFWQDAEYYDVDFKIHKTIRYHEKFRSFYETLHNIAAVASATASTSAFFVLLGSMETLATGLTAIVGLASVLALILQFDKKARLHDDLRRRLTDLAARVVLMEPNEANLRQVQSELLKIESDEPTLRRLVELQARNEESRARGCAEDQMVPLSKAQRFFGYVCTFGMSRLETWKATRETTEKCDPLGPPPQVIARPERA